MIKLRPLEKKDAKYMLEWMHDDATQLCFQKSMKAITIDEAERFCRNAIIPKKIENGDNLHWAIVEDNDEYLGTISLKEIDLIGKSAEYAIAMRPVVRGQGIAYEATKCILKYAFINYKLEVVYLNVWDGNIAAIKLYERSGFVCAGEANSYIDYLGTVHNQKRFEITRADYWDIISRSSLENSALPSDER